MLWCGVVGGQPARRREGPPRAADIVAVHWTARPDDARVSGLKEHRELDEVLLGSGWGRLLTHRDIEFTLTMWSRDVPDTMGR